MKVIVLHHQSLLDLAIQHTGTAENAFDLALANNRSITDDLEAGDWLIANSQELKANKDILSYYTAKKLQPATAIEPRERILERLTQEKGFVDWITISSSILFSAKYITSLDELHKQTLYNNIKQSDYNADGYLQGVERVQMDYKDLFEQFKNVENVVLLLDPPYLSTDVSSYKMDYWRISDYLDVINLLDKKPYFYFTSEKSQIIELAQWMSENGFKKSPFDKDTIKIIHTSLNYSAKYNDIMIYKR